MSNSLELDDGAREVVARSVTAMLEAARTRAAEHDINVTYAVGQQPRNNSI